MFLSPDFFLKTHSEAHESTSWRSPAEKQGIWYFVILISWASRLADFQSLGWMFFYLKAYLQYPIFLGWRVCVCVYFSNLLPSTPHFGPAPTRLSAAPGQGCFYGSLAESSSCCLKKRASSSYPPPPYLSNSRIISYSSLFMLRACFSSLLRSGFFFGRNKREKENKQTSGNAQMCRCTNRLYSSSVVVLGYLRGKGKQNKKGHQLHAMGHLCTGGTILELNVFQSSSEVFWHFLAKLICKDIQHLLPQGGDHTYFSGRLTSLMFPLSWRQRPKQRFCFVCCKNSTLRQHQNCSQKVGRFLGGGSSKQDQRCISHLRSSALQQLH